MRFPKITLVNSLCIACFLMLVYIYFDEKTEKAEEASTTTTFLEK